MRARGAKMTDIVVLVVAADDGPMPQTIEAINHARAAEVPIVVAVNKVDKPGANPAQIRTKLMEQNLIPEEFGGETIFIDVSAKTKQGIDKLLEMLALQAEVLELQGQPQEAGQGPRGRGPPRSRARRHLAPCWSRRGPCASATWWWPARCRGRSAPCWATRASTITEAGPATPVEVLGLDGVPDAGETLQRRHRREGGQVPGRAPPRSAPAQGGDRQPQRPRLAGEHPRQDQGRRGQGGQDRPQGRRARVGRGDRRRPARACRTPTVGVNVISVRRRRHHRVRRPAGQGLARPSSSASTSVPPASRSRWPSRRAWTSSSTRSSTTPSTTSRRPWSACWPRSTGRRCWAGPRSARCSTSPRSAPSPAAPSSTARSAARPRPAWCATRWSSSPAGSASLKRFKDDVSEVAQGYECGLAIEGYQDLEGGRHRRVLRDRDHRRHAGRAADPPPRQGRLGKSVEDHA